MTDDDRDRVPKLTVEEVAERYDDCAREYDETYDPTGDADDTHNGTYIRLVRLVVEYADPKQGDTVVDLGCGPGAVSLELAADANRVIGRDVSERMLAIARENAAERSIDNVTFDIGRFREPNVESADVVVTNLAIHHLDDDAKREAIEAIASLGPRRVVIGAAMFFEDRHPEEPEYDPAVVYPATVGDMVRWVTDAGYPVTVVEKCNPYTGVIVAEESVG